MQTRKTIQLILRVILLVLLGGILTWGIHLGILTTRLLRIANNVRADPAALQIETAGPLIQSATGDLAAIHRDLAPLFPLFDLAQRLPGVGSHLGQVEPLLVYTDGLAQAGNEIFLGLEPLLPLLDDSQGAQDTPIMEAALPVLQAGQEHFARAAFYLEKAGEVRGRIRVELLPGSMQPYFKKLDDNFHLISAGIDFLQVAPRILGAGEPQRYLVLAQNRDELRATGGYISGAGVVELQNGKILQFDLRDASQIDDFTLPYPLPPEALQRFMLADYWVTRDSNWSPDFPTAAAKARELYAMSTGIETRGVVAFNQLALRAILRVLGPLTVSGMEEPVTADNVDASMQQAWAPEPEQAVDREWWLHRKDFMQSLGGAIIERVLQTKDRTQLLALGKVFKDLLDSGQVLVYFNDPAAEGALEAGGWDGKMAAGDGDSLGLVDANVGFNKVDAFIRRSLDYRVDLGDLLHPTATVNLSYQHTGVQSDPQCKQEISYGSGSYQELQQRCYLDYWRVYLPAGTTLTTAQVEPVAGEQLLSGEAWPGMVEALPGEGGTQVFAGLLMLPAGQARLISLEVALPQTVVSEPDAERLEYRLRIHVQPGLENLPFRLEVKAPDTYSFVSPGAGWQLENYNTIVWQANLTRDTELMVSMQLTNSLDR